MTTNVGGLICMALVLLIGGIGIFAVYQQISKASGRSLEEIGSTVTPRPYADASVRGTQSHYRSRGQGMTASIQLAEFCNASS